MIADSAIFIGNQSSPYAIAEGLKHPSIQETSAWSPLTASSAERNARYCHDGALDLNLFGRTFLHQARRSPSPRHPQRNPAWGMEGDDQWCISARSYSFDMVVRDVRLKFRGGHRRTSWR